MFPVNQSDHPVRRVARMLRELSEDGKRIVAKLRAAEARPPLSHYKAVEVAFAHRLRHPTTGGVVTPEQAAEAETHLQAARAELADDLLAYRKRAEAIAQEAAGISRHLRYAMNQPGQYETKLIADLRGLWTAAESFQQGYKDYLTVKGKTDWVDEDGSGYADKLEVVALDPADAPEPETSGAAVTTSTQTDASGGSAEAAHEDRKGSPPISEVPPETVQLTEKAADVLAFLGKRSRFCTRTYIAANLPADRRAVGIAVKRLLEVAFVRDHGTNEGIGITDRGRAYLAAAQRTA